MTHHLETAIIAGGCFWCIEAALNELAGVETAVSGYTDGDIENPTYHQVCSELSGHTEAIKVTFDPTLIDYQTILEMFFTLHDPTTLNRQGNDVGTQYRSGIYYTDENQKQIAESVISQLDKLKLFDHKIVTEVKPESPFYPAESIHQGYAKNFPDQPYCVYLVNPKLAKFRQRFSEYLSK